MKIIHCADLHLDSKMNTHLPSEKARERKAEILHTFERLIEYAVQNGVSAIIIAGDLFDRKVVSVNARNTVYNAVLNNPEIEFYYLRGNHDADGFLSSIGELPKNLKIFGDGWTSYEIGDNIVITGAELSKNTPPSIYDVLALDSEKINIVTLHGQESASSSKTDAEIIGINSLKHKNIDYLALGHIHAYKRRELDARGVYCYSGCLEGRGFDEFGEHGFVLLDIDQNAVKDTFVPFAGRRFYQAHADISDCAQTADISEVINDAVSEIGSDAIVEVILEGLVDVECEKNIELLEKQLCGRFYFARVKDETRFKIDYMKFQLDKSLKGEFVRAVMEDDELGDEEKPMIIRYGIQALMGEEIE